MSSNQSSSSQHLLSPRLSINTITSSNKPLPHLPAELHLIIFKYLALLPRIHEPSPRWAVRPPRAPEVMLVSRVSREVAIREAGLELVPVCWREVKEKDEKRKGKSKVKKEVLKIWWGRDGRDVVYFGPLSIQHGVDMKIGLSLAPPRFYVGSYYSYTCSILDVSIFGGLGNASQETSEGSGGIGSARHMVRNVAVQKEVWEKLGSEKTRDPEQVLAVRRRFKAWWPKVEKVVVVEGDAKWFASRGEATFVRVKDSVGQESRWRGEPPEWGWAVVVERDGFRGWEECKKKLEERVAQSEGGETNARQRVAWEKTRYEWIGKGWLWGKSAGRAG